MFGVTLAVFAVCCICINRSFSYCHWELWSWKQLMLKYGGNAKWQVTTVGNLAANTRPWNNSISQWIHTVYYWSSFKIFNPQLNITVRPCVFWQCVLFRKCSMIKFCVCVASTVSIIDLMDMSLHLTNASYKAEQQCRWKWQKVKWTLDLFFHSTLEWLVSAVDMLVLFYWCPFHETCVE